MIASLRQETSATASAGKARPIRVLLVDDQVLFRRGIASLLRSQPDIEVVGESGDGLEAIEEARKLEPDLILMDIRMPRCDGIEATRMIKGEMPSVKIIALTVSEEERDLFQTIKSGAQGYLLKNLEPEELFSTIRGALRGEATVSPLMATKMLQEFSRHIGTKEEHLRSHLTEREKEVLRLIARGASNSEISARLCISESTARNHVHNILEKLHLRNRVEAAIYAIDHGLLPESGASHDLAEESNR